MVPFATAHVDMQTHQRTPVDLARLKLVLTPQP